MHHLRTPASLLMLIGFVYLLFEGIAWNHRFGVQDSLRAAFGAEFHDFAGSVVVHAVGGVAGALFVVMFTFTQNRWKIDDVLGVWPLHGLCGAWGGIAAGIFGLKAFGGIGGVSFMSQLCGTLSGITIAFAGGFAVYGLLKKTVGIRMNAEDEFNGADLSIHKISATAERESGW